jgi:hypothetical protein
MASFRPRNLLAQISGGVPRKRWRSRFTMKRRSLYSSCLALGLTLLSNRAETSTAKPPPADLSKHAFPALGAVAERKVHVEWNRFYDHAGLSASSRNCTKPSLS